MTKSSFQLSIDEINYLVVAVAVTAAAFIASSGDLTFQNSIFYLGVSAGVLLAREFGQRTIAQWMQANTELELSLEGAVLTVFGGIIAILTNSPFMVLFPISNSFSLESYEHWGKDIDAMWSKREAWIVYGGVISMMIGGVLFYILGMGTVSNAFWLFTVFQMLPFNNGNIPTGELDGAYVLRQNGFMWLVFMVLSLAGVVLL